MSKSQWQRICDSWTAVNEGQPATRARLNRHMKTMRVTHSSNDRWIKRIMRENFRLELEV
jgi:hypothetical protein